MTEEQLKEFLANLPEKPGKVTTPDEFKVGVIGPNHGHIFGMCRALKDCGAGISVVYDDDPKLVEAFRKQFPEARIASSEDEVLHDPSLKMIASSTIASERGPLGVRVMRAGKDYFVDKTPFTTQAQIDEARLVWKETGRRYFCYFSERVHTEAGVFAGYLIDAGVIGRVLQVIGMGPHRVGNPASRPAWFWNKEQYGGILCDIGSHQIEQYLFYSGAKDAKVVSSRVANYNHKGTGLEDFGDAVLTGDNGTTNYFRVDWFTPDGLSNWGDGRTVILGTEGHIELRKFVDLANGAGGMVLWADKDGEHKLNVSGLVGYPFFGQIIRDSLDGTETAMTQEYIFKAAELCVACEDRATVIE
ncbi:MAG: Gfo/Idh/MocA family oxidoreductase [Clostridia bacterium]|nr:Gfo/Idh/MocA family oxidoreductase [Clostridia bacterium]